MTTGATPGRLRAACLFAGVAALLVGTGSSAGAVEPADISQVCPPPAAGQTTAGFPDIDGDTHEATIRCAAGYGLVRGYGDGTYRPLRSITRGEMATFIRQLIETGRGVSLPPGDADAFPDVTDTVHADAIRALAGIDVVSGRSDGTYGPADPVTRGQMARFLANAIDYGHNEVVDGSRPYPVDEVPFPDAEDSTFRFDIADLAAIGVVQGDTRGNYRPGVPVTRAHMAAFVIRTAAYLDGQGVWAPTATLATQRVISSWVQVVDADGNPGRGEPGTLATITLTHDRLDRSLRVRYQALAPPTPMANPRLVLAAGPVTRPGADPVTLVEGSVLNTLAAGQAVEQVVDADGLGLDLSAIVAEPDRYLVALVSDERHLGVLRGQLPDGGLKDLPNRTALPRNAGVAVNQRTGTPTLTLAAATRDAARGDEIVGYGAFDERVFIEVADLTLRGHRLTRLHGAVHVLADGATVSGWHLQDFTRVGPDRVGILLNDVERVTITGTLVDGGDAAGTIGLMTWPDTPVIATVTGNDFVDSAVGLWTRRGSLVTIDDNLVAGHAVMGVHAQGDGQIRHNDFLDNARGLQLDMSLVTVRDNVFEANPEHVCVGRDANYDFERLRADNVFVSGAAVRNRCLVSP